jgi:uncharacterized protein YodC (DUF2158 family)
MSETNEATITLKNGDILEEGNTVKLKIGGPDMVVKNVGRYGGYGGQGGEMMAFCVWFDGTKLKEDTFKPCTLAKIQD